MDGVTFHDRLEFWGLEVPPNKKVDVLFGGTDEELVHLTQARSAHASTCARRAPRRLRCEAPAQRLGAARVLRSCSLLRLGRGWPCRLAEHTAHVRGRGIAAQGCRKARRSADAAMTFRSLPGCAWRQARGRARRRVSGGEGEGDLHRNPAQGEVRPVQRACPGSSAAVGRGSCGVSRQLTTRPRLAARSGAGGVLQRQAHRQVHGLCHRLAPDADERKRRG
jgi:hypothetical protein